MIRQMHVLFSGRVQGVGFRFTAEEKNLRDGRVEIVAEAEEDILNDFLRQIKEHFSSYIRDLDISWGSAQAAFSDFSVAF